MKHSAEEIENTIKHYSSHVLRFAFAYLKNTADAEDIAQEVFIIYAEKAPIILKESSKKAWLMSTTSNKCKDYLRSIRKHMTDPITEDICYLSDESESILSYVLSLEVKYRIPIHLHYYEGYSLKEIAEMTDSNVATVGTWLARGRELLKKMIGDDFDER